MGHVLLSADLPKITIELPHFLAAVIGSFMLSCYRIPTRTARHAGVQTSYADGAPLQEQEMPAGALIGLPKSELFAHLRFGLTDEKSAKKVSMAAKVSLRQDRN